MGGQEVEWHAVRERIDVPPYYRYHKAAGHSSKECDILKREIDALI